MNNTIMKIKFWGVRGSIPCCSSYEQIREKQAALITKIIEDGGSNKLFGDTANAEKNDRIAMSKKLRDVSG